MPTDAMLIRSARDRDWLISCRRKHQNMRVTPDAIDGRTRHVVGTLRFWATLVPASVKRRTVASMVMAIAVRRD
jgi:hypothetical protein